MKYCATASACKFPCGRQLHSQRVCSDDDVRCSSFSNSFDHCAQEARNPEKQSSAGSITKRVHDDRERSLLRTRKLILGVRLVVFRLHVSRASTAQLTIGQHCDAIGPAGVHRPGVTTQSRCTSCTQKCRQRNTVQLMPTPSEPYLNSAQLGGVALRQVVAHHHVSTCVHRVMTPRASTGGLAGLEAGEPTKQLHLSAACNETTGRLPGRGCHSTWPCG